MNENPGLGAKTLFACVFAASPSYDTLQRRTFHPVDTPPGNFSATRYNRRGVARGRATSCRLVAGLLVSSFVYYYLALHPRMEDAHEVKVGARGGCYGECE